MTVTHEEVPLRRKGLGTDYRYGVGINLSYTFGSIYNNIVKNNLIREEGGSSGRHNEDGEMNDQQCVAIIAAILIAGRLAWAAGESRPPSERLINDELSDAIDLYNATKKALQEKGS